MVLISLLSGLSIVSTTNFAKSSVYLEHHRDFLNSGTSATAGKVNSTIIKRDEQILGKFGEIQREFVDVYSPDSDNYCRESGGGHHCGTMILRPGLSAPNVQMAKSNRSLGLHWTRETTPDSTVNRSQSGWCHHADHIVKRANIES